MGTPRHDRNRPAAAGAAAPGARRGSSTLREGLAAHLRCLGATALLLAGAACGPGVGAEPPDAGAGQDAAQGRDDGGTHDAGLGHDAGTPPDAGDGQDAGAGDAGIGLDAGTETDAGVAPDGGSGSDGGPRDGGASDGGGGGGACPSLALPPDLTHGMRRVRSEPMVVSGLIPSMGAPSPSFASGYLDDFGATAVHLWQDALPGEMDGWRALRPGVRFIAWTLPDGTSMGSGGQVLGGYGPKPGRVGYQISDEPRSLADLKALEPGIAAIRAADPDALVILNFGKVTGDNKAPGEGGEIDTMIHYAVSHHLADVLSHDNYSLQNSGFAWLEGFRAAGLSAGLPYWRYIDAYRNGPAESLPTEADLRWHALLGVTYGYTGYTWFVYQIGAAHAPLTPVFFEAAGDQAAAKTPAFAWAAQINSELATYGKVLVHLTSLGVRHVSTSALLTISAVQTYDPSEGLDPYLKGVEITGGFTLLGNLAQEVLLGFFRDDVDRHYLVVQNLNRDGRSYVGNHADATLRLTFDLRSAPPEVRRDHLERLDGATGSVTQLTLVPSGSGTVEAELTLAAGDVAFLRTDDGCPWPGL